MRIPKGKSQNKSEYSSLILKTYLKIISVGKIHLRKFTCPKMAFSLQFYMSKIEFEPTNNQVGCFIYTDLQEIKKDQIVELSI